MVLFIFLVAFGALTLALTYWVYGADKPLEADPDNIHKSLYPVDLDLLQNLLDPEQERYIRGRLTPSQFFRFKIKQFKTANEYISRASHNSAVFAAIGRYASNSSDADTAAVGQAILEAAIRLRILVLVARVNLTLKLISPDCSIGRFIDGYANARTRVAHFRTPRSIPEL